MLLRRVVSVSSAVALLAGVSFLSAQGAGADGPEQRAVGLHNTSAEEAPCPDDVGVAWHFVAPPKSKTDFISITLLLDGGPVSIGSWLEHPLSGDAYVTVPAGYTLGSLQGGTFVITDSSGDFKNVRLSHTCDGDGGGGGDPEPPTVTVSKTAEVTYVDEYDWTVEKRLARLVPGSASADLHYVIDVWKSDVTSAVADSYEVTGTITVKNESTDDSVADIVDLVENGLTNVAANCSLDDVFLGVVLAPDESASVGYTCTGIVGIPSGDDTNTATATLQFGARAIPVEGSVNFSWGDATVRDTLDDSATLTDDNLPGWSAVFGDDGSYEYVKLGVPAGGSNCNPGFANTATLTEDDTDVQHTSTVTVPLCTTTGGHTIGYWFAAPAGNAQTVTAFPLLKASYPAVLTMSVMSMNSSKKVKDFARNANCSGDCKTMLQAQFIATAMSVATGGGAFGGQCIYVPTWINGTGQTTISVLLMWINTNYADFTTPQRVEVKSILDAINNNATLACI